MRDDCTRRRHRPTDRHRDDTGGVWINTGIVLGVLFYLFILTMLVAGFEPVLPLVVIPPVVVGLIAANNLLGGGRAYGRSSAARAEPRRATTAEPAEEPLPPR